MNKLNETLKSIIKYIVLLSLIFLILGYFFRGGHIFLSIFGQSTFMAYFFGLLMGTLFSILKIIALKRTLVIAVTLTTNRAKLYTAAQSMVRLILTGVILFVAIKNPNVDFFGAVIGVLLTQPASYIAGFLIKNDPSLAIAKDEDEDEEHDELLDKE